MKQWVKMTKDYILDTNVIVRLLLQDIPSQYNQAKKLFTDAKSGKIKVIIPQIVIFEINFTLQKYYHVEKEEIINKLGSLVKTKYLQVESREVLTAALALYRTTVTASFVDCFLMSKSDIDGAELVTFDKKLLKLK